jgi:septal ring factor EnvC (AmiA/AmiB activator)
MVTPALSPLFRASGTVTVLAVATAVLSLAAPAMAQEANPSATPSTTPSATPSTTPPAAAEVAPKADARGAPTTPDAAAPNAAAFELLDGATTPGASRRKLRESELAALRSRIDVSIERQAALAEEVADLDADRASLNAALIETAREIGELERSLTGAEGRLLRLDESMSAIRLSLDERRGTLVEVLAALERLGRDPPPALLVAPADARDAVRGALLLGAVTPQIRVEAEALAADLATMARLKTDADAELERFTADLASIAVERERVELLLAEKRRLYEQSTAALAEERSRAEALAGQATGLQDLIGRMEAEVEASRQAATAARDSKPKGGADPGRLSPATAFVATRGTLPLPVAGAVVRRFGETADDGTPSQGWSIDCTPGARVTAPADGWAVYAGPFRSYGKILILNVGDGYHLLLAGLDRIDVDLGQFVLAGEPVGTMGGQVLARADGTGVSGDAPVDNGPALYVEFRKDGSSIDPAPWWAGRADQEVRG